MADYPADLSGLDILKGCLDGTIPTVTGLHETLGIRMVEVGEGCCVFEGAPSESHRNPHGTIHGGWAASILDGVMGLAVFSCQPPGQMSATATLEIKTMRPLAIGETYRAEANVLRAGRSLAHVEGRLVHTESGKLVATGTSTYAVFPRPA